jgi:hypothetical protein
MVMKVDKTIAVPCEVAFDAMADARNEPDWNAKVTRSDLVSGEPIEGRSRFETVNRGQNYAATITEFSRPSRLAFEVTGKMMDITATFEFSAGADGTIVQESWDFRPKKLLKLAFPLMSPMIVRDLPKQMESFAKFCTRRATT